eukprot:407839-Rhodomonas_salina.1
MELVQPLRPTLDKSLEGHNARLGNCHIAWEHCSGNPANSNTEYQGTLGRSSVPQGPPLVGGLLSKTITVVRTPCSLSGGLTLSNASRQIWDKPKSYYSERDKLDVERETELEKENAPLLNELEQETIKLAEKANDDKKVSCGRWRVSQRKSRCTCAPSQV